MTGCDMTGQRKEGSGFLRQNEYRKSMPIGRSLCSIPTTTAPSSWQRTIVPRQVSSASFGCGITASSWQTLVKRLCPRSYSIWNTISLFRCVEICLCFGIAILKEFSHNIYEYLFVSSDWLPISHRVFRGCLQYTGNTIRRFANQCPSSRENRRQVRWAWRRRANCPF